MPIVTADLAYRLSGGASNTDPTLSIGGAKSTTAVNGATLFDAVSSAESAAGDVEYRCYYAHNGHATLTLTSAVAWISANTPSASTTLDIGVGAAAVNGTETAITNESTAPAGVTFSAAASKGAGIALGDIPAGQHRAVWVRRTINAGAGASSDTATLRFEGDTAA